jgi:hypothetical protein
MEMTDTLMLLAALVSFGVLLIGWMVLPADAGLAEAPEPTALRSPRTA